MRVDDHGLRIGRPLRAPESRRKVKKRNRKKQPVENDTCCIFNCGHITFLLLYVLSLDQNLSPTPQIEPSHAARECANGEARDHTESQGYGKGPTRKRSVGHGD